MLEVFLCGQDKGITEIFLSYKMVKSLSGARKFLEFNTKYQITDQKGKDYVLFGRYKDALVYIDSYIDTFKIKYEN